MTSKFLLGDSEFPLIASPKLSAEIGRVPAIFLQKLHFFLTEEKQKLKTHNKRKWWFHSFENWKNTIGFFSIATIKRAVKKLEELGLIEVNKLSENKSDRTNYYTINYAKLAEKFGIKNPTKEKRKAVTHNQKIQQKIVGTDKPQNDQASHSKLEVLPTKQRELYMALRRQKVDVSHDDERLSYWCIKKSAILAYASSACSRLDINRWQWHTPDQIFPKEFLGTTT